MEQGVWQACIFGKPACSWGERDERLGAPCALSVCMEKGQGGAGSLTTLPQQP